MDEIFVHENFTVKTSNSPNDIALLRLGIMTSNSIFPETSERK